MKNPTSTGATGSPFQISALVPLTSSGLPPLNARKVVAYSYHVMGDAVPTVKLVTIPVESVVRELPIGLDVVSTADWLFCPNKIEKIMYELNSSLFILTSLIRSIYLPPA